MPSLPTTGIDDQFIERLIEMHITDVLDRHTGSLSEPLHARMLLKALSQLDLINGVVRADLGTTHIFEAVSEQVARGDVNAQDLQKALDASMPELREEALKPASLRERLGRSDAPASRLADLEDVYERKSNLLFEATELEHATREVAVALADRLEIPLAADASIDDIKAFVEDEALRPLMEEVSQEVTVQQSANPFGNLRPERIDQALGSVPEL